MSSREATLLQVEDVPNCSRLLVWWPTINHGPQFLSFCILYYLPVTSPKSAWQLWLPFINGIYWQIFVNWGLSSWDICLLKHSLLEPSHHYSVRSLAIHTEENSAPDQQPQWSSQMVASTNLPASHITVILEINPPGPVKLHQQISRTEISCSF